MYYKVEVYNVDRNEITTNPYVDHKTAKIAYENAKHYAYCTHEKQRICLYYGSELLESRLVNY